MFDVCRLSPGFVSPAEMFLRWNIINSIEIRTRISVVRELRREEVTSPRWCLILLECWNIDGSRHFERGGRERNFKAVNMQFQSISSWKITKCKLLSFFSPPLFPSFFHFFPPFFPSKRGSVPLLRPSYALLCPPTPLLYPPPLILKGEGGR